MAVPDGTIPYLRTWANTFRQHYYPGIADQMQRFGKTTKLMPAEKPRLDGPSMEFEVATRHNRSSRLSRDLMAVMPDPGPGAYARFTTTFDHNDPDNNDFAALEITFRTTFYDMKKRGDSTWKGSRDPITTDIEQGLADLQEKFSKYMHLPSSGLLASLPSSGTNKVNDDAANFNDCSTYTAGSDTCKIKLDSGSIALIGWGDLIEIRTAADVLVVNNVRVTAVHPYEHTIDIQITDDSVNGFGAAITNFNGVANSYKIFFSGAYNVAPAGTLEPFFDETVEYYGRDRTAAAYKAMMPIKIEPASTTDFTARLLREVGRAAAWGMGASDATMTKALVLADDQDRMIQRFAEGEGVKIVPGSSQDVSGSIRRVVGDDGWVLHDPNLGQMAYVVDDFAPYGKIRFLDMSSWLMVLPWGDSEFDFIPGEIEGIWTRNSENDGSGRPSKVYSANGIFSFCFVNLAPFRQIELNNLTSADPEGFTNTQS